MYQKIRFRLTLLSGSIVTLIFIIMSFGYLRISENNLFKTKMETYEKDVKSIANTLETQSSISSTWLSNLSKNKEFYISVYDNGHEFLFNKVSTNQNQEKLQAAWDYYRCNQDDLEQNVLSFLTYYKTFRLDNTLCYVITYGEKQSFELLLCAPVEQLKKEIIEQRVIFISIMSTALIAIWFLSWFFIGKLLRPIEEARIKQNHFIAAASHELRTPLAVIISATEDMIEDTKFEKSHDSIELVQKEAYRMSNLLTDMLTLSSKDSGHFEINKTNIELDTLLLNVYESFQTMMKHKSITCELNFPEDAISLYEGDKDKLYQLFAILIHNAISYTPEGGHIIIAIRQSDAARTSFLIEVADNGPGIADEDKDKIFDRFYRSDSARSTKGHFGLGLSIAYEIVQAHGGKIEVTDTDVINRSGAKFIIHL